MPQPAAPEVAVVKTTADTPPSYHLLLVDDDPLFADTLALNLEDEGYEVTLCRDGQAAVDKLREGLSVDLVLLDWRMPRLDGLATLKAIRPLAPNLPVIFLTSLGDPLYEEAALDKGAVDFVEKNRSFGVVLKRIHLGLARQQQAQAAAEQGNAGTPSSADPHLQLRPDGSRVVWKGVEVPLTLTEAKVVTLLAARRGTDVTFRQIYDVVRGQGFLAGSGDNGYRANVRAMIRRIRQKFRDVDPTFDRLETYSGFGYRWREDDGTQRP
jgi:two-component system response regulator ChvI